MHGSTYLMSSKKRLLRKDDLQQARFIHMGWKDASSKASSYKMLMSRTAPDLIEHLISECGLSLRQVARRIKRSPTLVSQIRNGHQACCPLTFGLLLDLLPPEKERTEDE